MAVRNSFLGSRASVPGRKQMTLCISSGMGAAFQMDPEDCPKRHFEKVHKICDFGCQLTEGILLTLVIYPSDAFQLLWSYT